MNELAMINLSNLDGLETVVFDTGLVSTTLWEEVRDLHFRSLSANTTEDRAKALVKLDDPKHGLESYIENRVDPNITAQDLESGWNPNQLFRDPTLTATFDRKAKLIGSVLTANNTSGASELTKWAKMMTPPDLSVPIIGGRRYVHLREIASDPEYQTPVNGEIADLVASGLDLVGILVAIKTERSLFQTLKAYTVPGDPADRPLTLITRAMNMKSGGVTANTLKGYNKEDGVQVMYEEIGALTGNLLSLAGISRVIDSINVSRVSKEAIKTRQKQANKDDKRKFDTTHEEGYPDRHDWD